MGPTLIELAWRRIPLRCGPAILLALAAAAGCAAESAAGGAPPGTEWSATYAGQRAAARLVISSPAEWAATWSQVFSESPVPAVDFERFVVACVFLGERPSGGYRVVFGEPSVRGAEYVIPYTEAKPSGAASMALTQPCAMKVFEPGPGLRVVIEQSLAPAAPAIAPARTGAPAATAASETVAAETRSAELAGVARFEIPAGWVIEKSRGTADPSCRIADEPDIIRVRLLGGNGSRYATMADYLAGFEATTMGRPAEKLRIIRVAGAETWLYRHGYPINLGDPHVADPRPPQLAEEEFCLLPLGTRFIVLSWAREDLPDSTGRDEEIWKAFLESFRLTP